MKKLISLALCLVMICCALVSCEDAIGEDLHKEGGLYEQGLQSNVDDPVAEIDLYVVVSDDVDFTDLNDTDRTEEEIETDSQYNTVQTQLNVELKGANNTKLYIHYVNEKDYDAVIEKAVLPGYNPDGKGRSETADVILINSKALYDKLIADDMLLALDSQLAKNTYGMLNAHVADSLWQATKTTVNGETHQYVVPNNRIVGTYTYLLLNRSDVQDHAYSERYLTHGNYTCDKCGYLYDMSESYSITYMLSSEKTKALTIDLPAGTKLEDVESLIMEKEKLSPDNTEKYVSQIKCLNSKCKANYVEGKDFTMIDLMDPESKAIEKIFKDMYGNDWADVLDSCIVEGNYADKTYFENGEHTDLEGDTYYCKVLAYPHITTEEAFESAYAIVRDNANSLRCMDLIKSINLDETVRNALQFGKETVNYTVVVDPVTKEKTVVPTEDNKYVMNPLHTGNIFTMYYIDGVWDADMKSWAAKQNDESYFKAN